MRRLVRVSRSAGALSIGLLLCGHVGTNDLTFAGAAGPWTVRVGIRQPGVIPGLSEITVHVAEPGVERVLVSAGPTRGFETTEPPADTAAAVRGQPGLFAAQLWLMVRGPHAVTVTVEGEAGAGSVSIPIVASATKQLAMTRDLEIFVLAGGLFLVFGLLTIVSSAARESVLEPGAAPATADRRRARWTTAVAALVLALTLFGGWTWVRSESESHRASLDRTWSSEATVRTDGATLTLDLAITEPLWVNRAITAQRTGRVGFRQSDLTTDHGKLMHMFLIREPDLDAFAHIHPVRVDDSHFNVAFPPLPPGRYRVYADLVHENSYSHTLYTMTDAPAAPPSSAPTGGPAPALSPADQANRDTGRPAAGEASGMASVIRPAPDPDDAWWLDPVTAASLAGAGMGGRSGALTPPATAGADLVDRLADGTVIRFLDGSTPLVAGTDADLAFSVEDADGRAVALDPYMGMSGHAMINRIDGRVFVHLHPVGMVSMPGRGAMATGGEMSRPGEGMNMAGTAGAMSSQDGIVTFPLVLPDPGRYRIWVQVRRGDDVLTGSFTTDILPDDGQDGRG